MLFMVAPVHGIERPCVKRPNRSWDLWPAKRASYLETVLMVRHCRGYWTTVTRIDHRTKQKGTYMNIFRRKSKDVADTQSPASQTLERCCLCGALTDVDVATPVQERTRYMPGAGQLCRDCCYEVYGTDDLRTLPDFG